MKDKLIRLIRILIIIISFLLVVSLIGNISRTRHMQQTLAEAEKSLEELRSKQATLQQDLSVIESDFYLEKEARNKLGLVKENEIVIVLPNEEILRQLAHRKENSDEYEELRPNWKKWVELFIQTENL
jgi:cell division protein FtsB